MEVTRYDDVLLGILQHCEQIQPFLEVVFSFLARRTDFFRLMQSREDKMGFPPGVADKMVIKVFKKYQGLVRGQSGDKKEVHKGQVKEEKGGTATTATSSSSLETQHTAQREHVAVVEKTAPQVSSVDGPPVVSTVEVETSTPDQSEPVTSTAHEQGNQNTATSTVPEASAPISSASGQPEMGVDAENKGLKPGKIAECYNGAVLDQYTWSQNIREIDIKVPIPPDVTKSRDVGVEIKSSYLRVWLKKNSSERENNILLEGKLQRTVKCEESMWSLEPKRCIQINLEKTEERFWTTVLEGDPEINKTEVDTTRDIGDFDEQTQTDFQRVMFDHYQKLQGKPTSQEAKTHDMLKKAWNAKGSPFQGTPFDPSKVNISPGSG